MKAKLAAIESSQEHSLKGGFPNVYWSDNYMAYYNFCQQCENHFATSRAKKSNRILFTTSFL